MSSWRNLVLDKITVEESQLVIVCDPDGLLQEENLLLSLREKGYNVILYDDPVAFRYIYESEYRQKWDKGEETKTRILLLNKNRDQKMIPYDILQRGSVVSIGIHHIFPKLSYTIVEKVEKSYYEELYAAHEKYDEEPLGDRETKKFILERVYSIVLQSVKTDKDLFKMLFRIHYKKVEIPDILAEYLMNALRTMPALRKWELETLFDREKFFQLLQGKWHDFLVALSSGIKVEIPFDEREIRGYIEDLFLEGVLSPVEVPEYSGLPLWTHVGITVDPFKDTKKRLKKLLIRIEKEVEKASKYRDWQEIARLWAEGLYFRYRLGWEIPEDLAHFTEVHKKIELLFKKWLLTNFGTLCYLPYRPAPVMVHHIPHYIASEVKEKIALIVIDGLALDQWRVIREELDGFLLEEHVVYSWVPTLTFTSRRSLFAGDSPHYFATMSSSTNDEPHWVKFWQDKNYSAEKIYYKRGIKLIDPGEVDEIVCDPKKTILGLVVNTVDDFMHSAQMGTFEMHQKVRIWVQQGYFNQLIDELLDRGFDVYISSDHGNVYATGRGTPREGVLVEKKGNRARIYGELDFLMKTAHKFPSVVWPEEYFTPGYSVLLADGLSAFARDGEKVVAHGGISLEEVLVPFIRVRRGG
ncbi:MAG: BREX-3 system phosphatase PglZ [Theionarchaea archaeon]|nr:MAG: hypothetical protein AYK19_16735 [Theionarchaea archaeon DG-70-1]MBU7026773.1 BREX-3 system phosphatase PglZ [Theionarchaea archaeon]